jgi:hypothetical protein
MSACSAKANQHGTTMRSSAGQVMPQRFSNMISTMPPHDEIVVVWAFSAARPNDGTISKVSNYC